MKTRTFFTPGRISGEGERVGDLCFDALDLWNSLISLGVLTRAEVARFRKVASAREAANRYQERVKLFERKCADFGIKLSRQQVKQLKAQSILPTKRK